MSDERFEGARLDYRDTMTYGDYLCLDAVLDAVIAAARERVFMFQAPIVDDALRDKLRAVDIDQTTPLEALRLLAAFKRDADEA